LIHYFLGQRLRWLFLLTASYLFYASLKVPYLLGVITLVTGATYAFGLSLHKAKEDKHKKRILWAGIATNVLILIVLKYVPFLTENLNALLSFFDSPISVHHAPLFAAIGVSYYVFQAISYLSDIYLEIEAPERHFGYFALYLAFFPKLLQGPIERAGDLLPQLKKKYAFNYDNMRFGMLLFTWGLFKKVVLADRLGLYVDAVYGDVHSYQGLPLLLATYAYAFQIYFDFSGYTDMALGTARVFNIHLTNNFNSPYLATSVADFWRRWHITFSRWILDYIFKPLQMQWRNGKNWGTAAALLVTFLVSGLWHGASWGFIIWGLLHGLYMAGSVFYRPYQKRIHKALRLEKTKGLKAWQIFVTFNLVCFAWIFFRSLSINDAIYLTDSIFNSINYNYFSNINILNENGKLNKEIYYLLISIIVYLSLEKNKFIYNKLLKTKIYIRWTFYYIIIISILILYTNNYSEFIYFRF
jgi:D-alanyl-lipoteichoic acid acyltransferase DltB (MBOAT superfamily)